MIKYLFKIPYIRKKFVHCIKYDFFSELELSMPIKNGYWANLTENDSYDSFSEIFVENEYKDFVPEIKIKSLLDFGAHYGFFTIWIQSNQPDHKIHTLLVEPASRCKKALDTLVKDSETNITFINKCIDNPRLIKSEFYERPHMASSRVPIDNKEKPVKIPILQVEEITNWKSPPYDLLKCDIEGAEYTLVNEYSFILQNTRYLIIEWHKECGDYKDLLVKICKLEFKLLKSKFNKPSNPSTAVLLFKNNLL